MAKGVKTGGRKKGSLNKATLSRSAAIVSSGLLPLDYFLSLLRDENTPELMRFEAAKAAAPYIHAKLAAIEHTGKDGAALIPPVMVVPGVLSEADWERAAPSQQEQLASKEMEVAANPRALQ